jgi:integrase
MSNVKMYLTKRANGIYYICIKSPDGRTHWKSTKCSKKPDAYHFLQSFEESYNSKPSAVIPTFSEFLKVYEAIQSSVIRKSTMGLYKILTKKFIELNADRPLNMYTSLEFEQSRAKQIANGISVTRMNMYTRCVKTMFNFALKQNIIQVNPLENVKQIKQPKQSPAFFTYNDLVKITALVTNEQLKSFYIVAFFTGMRISELLNLKWSHIDFENNQIKVSNSDDFTTKSGKERIIPVLLKLFC